MNNEIKNKVTELVMIAGLNTAHDYDGINNEEDMLLYLDALIKHYAERCKTNECKHKNLRYESHFTFEEIFCKDCDEYLGQQYY